MAEPENLAETPAIAADNVTVIHYPQSASYFAAACAIFFVVIGVTGNLLTIIALSRSRKLRANATTAFVLSLAFSDLLFCLINLPPTASRYIHQSWVLGESLCQLFPFFFYGNVAASLMSMVLITINRYTLILSPAVYDRVYRRQYVILMILGVWIFCFSMLIPTMAGRWGQFGLDPPSFSCTILRNSYGSPKKFLFFFGVLLPCVTIVVCYTGIFIKVRQSRRKVMSHSPAALTATPSIDASTEANRSPQVIKSIHKENQNKLQRKEDIRLTRMMLIIFCCFLICFLPLMIVNVADDDVKVPVIHVLASIMAWASSVVNPFIYAFSNRQYRSAYRQLFSRGSGRRTVTSGTHSRSSGRTFFTDMLQYTPQAEKVKVLNRTNSNNQAEESQHL